MRKRILSLPPSQVKRAHRAGGPKAEGLTFCVRLLCAPVLLAGPFEHVRAIGERWKGKWSSPTCPWAQGRFLNFWVGQYTAGAWFGAIFLLPQSLGRQNDNSSRRAEDEEIEGCQLRAAGAQSFLPATCALQILCSIWKYLHRGPSRKLAQGHNTSGQDHSSTGQDALPAPTSLEAWIVGCIFSPSKWLSKSDSSELHTHFCVLSSTMAGDIVCSTSIQITAGKSFAWRARTGVKSLTE